MSELDVMNRLLDLPGVLADARCAVLALDLNCQESHSTLKDEEARLTLLGLPGKNAEERSAFLRMETQGFREVAVRYERRKAAGQINVQRLQDELSALRAYARLCGGGD